MNHTALMSRGPRERSIYLSPGLANGSQCCIKRNALDSACIHSFGLSLGSSECDRLNSTPHSTKNVPRYARRNLHRITASNIFYCINNTCSATNNIHNFRRHSALPLNLIKCHCQSPNVSFPSGERFRNEATCSRNSLLF